MNFCNMLCCVVCGENSYVYLQYDTCHLTHDVVYYDVIYIPSRKRGPLSGAGFVCARDEKSFLTLSQATMVDIPFLPGPADSPFMCAM